MSVCLIRFSEDDVERQVEIKAGDVLFIGRAPAKQGTSLVLPTEQVSLRHAEIHCSERACTIVDVGSVFGTWVNDKKLNKGRHCTLHPGDVLKLGTRILKVIVCPEKDTDGLQTQAACRSHLKAITRPDHKIPSFSVRSTSPEELKRLSDDVKKRLAEALGTLPEQMQNAKSVEEALAIKKKIQEMSRPFMEEIAAIRERAAEK